MAVTKIATRLPVITVFSSGVIRKDYNLASLYPQAVIQLPNGEGSQWWSRLSMMFLVFSTYKC